MSRAWVRPAAALLSAALSVAGSGCAAVVATAGVASSVAATTVKTAGKVTVATVKTTGKVVTSAVTTSGDMTSLTIDSAGKLARAGMVVSVDAATGTIYETPWEEGLRLSALIENGRFGAAAEAATIFRGRKKFDVSLRRVRERIDDVALKSADVVEFRPRR